MELPLFVYGTLQLPAIQRLLTGKVFPSRPARVAGFRRGLVRGERYPSLAPAPGSAVEGLLLEGVGAAALARLDAYEGPHYERIRAKAVTDSGSRACWLWLLRPEHLQRVTFEPFDLELFAARDLPGFLTGYPGFSAGDQ
jgi:gamma-glutamylcyclotransferase (GGCT)/AIG2-like uncharacterized protein YtfP